MKQLISTEFILIWWGEHKNVEQVFKIHNEFFYMAWGGVSTHLDAAENESLSD